MSSSDPGVSREQPEIVAFGPYRFDRRGLLLSLDGETISVTPKALLVLRCLLDRPGHVVRKDDLLRQAWDDAAVTESSLTEAVRALRQALKDDPRSPTYVETAHRRGYRFIAPVVDAGTLGEKGGEVGPDGVAALLAHGLRAWTESELTILRAAVIGLTLMVLGTAVVLSYYRRLADELSTPASAMRVPLSLPADMPMRAAAFAISPDGQRLAYVSETGGTRRLVLLRFDDASSRALPGSEGVLGTPSFSPDGQALVFKARAGGQGVWLIKRLPVDGGTPIVLASARNNPQIVWAADGNVYVDEAPDGLARVPAAGGELERLIGPDRVTGAGYSDPHLLPDRRTLLLTARTSGEGVGGVRTVLRSLDTGEERDLLEDTSRARYLATGHLLYRRDGTWWAAPFDTESLRLTGPETRIGDLVRPAVSETGTLVHMGSPVGVDSSTAPPNPQSVPLRVDFDGGREPLPLPAPDRCRYPSLAPDGVELAVVCRDTEDQSDVWIGHVERGTFTRRMTEGEDFTPIWTPDGSLVTYSSHRDGVWSLRTGPADGGGPEVTLLESEHQLYPSSWSPDGEVLAFQWILPETGEDIWLLRRREGAGPVPWRASPAHESGARFSPEGNWIVYHSNESGAWHVYVGEYPGPGATTQLSSADGGWPVWSRDGRRLYYLANPSATPMVIDMDRRGGLEPGRPRPVFESGIGTARDRQGPAFDLALDDTFLIVGPPRLAGPTTRLQVVFNWFEELERLAPTGR